jgi:hypothetical protein
MLDGWFCGIDCSDSATLTTAVLGVLARAAPER